MILFIVVIFVFLGSDLLLLRLAASGSKSPIVDIIEHAPCVPTPHLTTPLNAISTAHPLDSFVNADIISPPMVATAPRPGPLREEGAEELIRSYRKAKREKDGGQGKWSADAKKRYDEYQKMWSKFRQTSPRKEEDEAKK